MHLMMKFLRGPGKKPITVQTELPKSTKLEIIRQLWEMEQFFNNLGADLRVHIKITETPEDEE